MYQSSHRPFSILVSSRIHTKNFRGVKRKGKIKIMFLKIVSLFLFFAVTTAVEQQLYAGDEILGGTKLVAD